MSKKNRLPLASKIAIINNQDHKDQQGMIIPGAEYQIEDYWDAIAGMSWQDSGGNPAAMHYDVRSHNAGLPRDDEVLYGKIGHLGHLVHVSELE